MPLFVKWFNSVYGMDQLSQLFLSDVITYVCSIFNGGPG